MLRAIKKNDVNKLENMLKSGKLVTEDHLLRAVKMNRLECMKILEEYYKRVSEIEVIYGFETYYDHAILLYYLGKKHKELSDILNYAISPLLFI